MTLIKRLFDITFSIILFIILAIPMVIIGLIILIQSGRPVFYISKRMKDVSTPFCLIKFRTMNISHKNSGVSGADKTNRITPIGKILRTYRLDEMPQLINIMRGDMSFVGPRPPLQQYTKSHQNLYKQVLKSRPGVTGLATAVFHKHEEYLLSKCSTVEETDATYQRRCIPRKAHIDLIYQKNQSLSLDLYVLFLTLSKFLPFKVGRMFRS